LSGARSKPASVRVGIELLAAARVVGKRRLVSPGWPSTRCRRPLVSANELHNQNKEGRE